LRFICMTSQASVLPAANKPAAAVATSITGLWLQVQASSDEKCVRCWQYVADIGVSHDHPELCGRCVTNVTGQGEVRAYA